MSLKPVPGADCRFPRLRVIPRPAEARQHTAAAISASDLLHPLYVFQPSVRDVCVARSAGPCAAARSLAVHRDRAGIGRQGRPGHELLLCSATMDRFFVPTCGLHRRRAQRRSRMAATCGGHPKGLSLTAVSTTAPSPQSDDTATLPTADLPAQVGCAPLRRAFSPPPTPITPDRTLIPESPCWCCR